MSTSEIALEADITASHTAQMTASAPHSKACLSIDEFNELIPDSKLDHLTDEIVAALG